MTPPVKGLLHLVVSGNEIGSPKYDLIARYPKACDSIKSPFKLKLSIFSIDMFLKFFRYSLIVSTKNLFFLPPPQIKNFFEK